MENTEKAERLAQIRANTLRVKKTVICGVVGKFEFICIQQEREISTEEISKCFFPKRCPCLTFQQKSGNSEELVKFLTLFP